MLEQLKFSKAGNWVLEIYFTRFLAFTESKTIPIQQFACGIELPDAHARSKEQSRLKVGALCPTEGRIRSAGPPE